MNTTKHRLRITTTNGALSCAITYDENTVKIRTPFDLGVLDAAACYAVVRYIRHCPKLRDKLITTAVRFGLNTGRCPHKTLTVCTPARFLELPGRQADITFRISAGEIEIKALRVC